MWQSHSQVGTLPELLRDRAQKSPEKEALIWLQGGEIPSNPLTFGQLDLRARAIAYRLQSQLKIGERVLLVYPYDAGLEFISAFLGCLYAGVVPVPSHSPRNRYGWDDLKARLLSSQASALLTVSRLKNRLKGNLEKIEELEKIIQRSDFWILPNLIPDQEAKSWQCPNIKPDSLAFLQYTSGSTGIPKGVMITHSQLIHNQNVLWAAFGHSERSVGMGWLPLFHDMGLIGNLIQPLYVGFLCVLMSPISFMQKPVRWLNAISKFRATTSGGPNFAYDLLCRYVSEKQRQTLNLSSWEVAFVGAEPVQEKTLSQFARKFASCGFEKRAFYPCYGMAEATLFISGGHKTKLPTVLTVDEGAVKNHQVRQPLSSQIGTQEKPCSRTLVSCGYTWGKERIVIANPEKQTLCASDEIGEIWVSGEGIGKGYWQQPIATAETFYAYLQDTGEGPFLRTGDLGFLYQGELFITGRRHDVMVFWGLNHYPQQIEQTVQRCHQAFENQSGAAFAVQINGENRLVIAQEVKRRDRHRMKVSEVVEPIRWAIFNQHLIDVYSIILLKPGTIPKTSSGKIQRSRCREQFLEKTLPILDQWQASCDQAYDMPTLIGRYLNPLVHLKRYCVQAQTYLNRTFNQF